MLLYVLAALGIVFLIFFLAVVTLLCIGFQVIIKGEEDPEKAPFDSSYNDKDR